MNNENINQTFKGGNGGNTVPQLLTLY